MTRMSRICAALFLLALLAGCAAGQAETRDSRTDPPTHEATCPYCKAVLRW